MLSNWNLVNSHGTWRGCKEQRVLGVAVLQVEFHNSVRLGGPEKR